MEGFIGSIYLAINRSFLLEKPRHPLLKHIVF